MKYNISSFEQFTACAIKQPLPMYIERTSKHFPIPELIGMIYPFKTDDELKLVLCLAENNPDIEYEEFIRMLVNIDLPDTMQVSIFTSESLLDLYALYNKQDYNIFVFDKTILNSICESTD